MAKQNPDLQLGALLDTSSVGIYRADIDGAVLYINASAREMIGAPVTHLWDDAWLGQVHPSDVERVRHSRRQVLVEHLSARIEHRFVQAEGGTSWVLAEARPVTDDSESVIGFLGSLTDITDIKRAEEAVRTSEERFRMMAELLPETVFEFDSTGTVTFVNAAGLAMSQYSVEDVGVGFHIMSIVAPSDAQRAGENIARMWTGVAPRPNEYVLRRKDGSEFPGVIHVSTIVKNGRPVGGRGIIVDLTELRAAENAKSDLEDELRRAQEAETLGALAGGVAHDMNNVLTVITSLASVTHQEAEASSPIADDMAAILSACERGQSLTRNLLGFARRGKYRAEQFSIDAAIRDVVRLLKRTIPKQMVIETDLAADPLVVVGDSHQVGHVLLNLAINAVDAMGAKGVLRFETCSVELSADDTADSDLHAGAHVRVRVVDDGAGMDEVTLARAFEPFFTTKNRSDGTGLGLSMVYGTVRSHRGETTLQSQVGRGTAVTVLLPGVEPTAADSEPASNRGPLIEHEGTVLLVDDDPLIRKSGSRLLKSLGYEVVLAAEGREAVEVFHERPGHFAVVILDLMMPVMDGEEAFDALRDIAPDVSIIISSGFAKGDVAEALLAKGAQGFLEKPYTLRELSAALRPAERADA